MARVLSVGATAAKRAPLLVLVLVLVVTAVATVSASQVSTSFEPQDNIAEEAPEWTRTLPEGMQPGEYSVREDLRYVNDRFLRPNSRVQILVEGEVSTPETLERLDRARDLAADQPVTVMLSSGELRTDSPLGLVERVAAENDGFADAVAAADGDGDGVPDRNLDALYDRLFDLRPEAAAAVLHRVDGEYAATRLSVSVDPEAPGEATRSQLRSVAAVLDGDGLRATATGTPIVRQEVQDYLLWTLVVSLVATLVAIAALLAVGFRLVHGSATLGLVTLLPVGLVVSWIVGTMTVLGYPLSVLTAVVASVTVGIGIDYSIHVGERFRSELDAGTDVETAVERTVRGTGAALFGSAATTAVGFGVLGFALFPVLQQFGTITAIMIAYAFLASLLVLPSLLVLWARYVGPAASARRRREPAPSVDPAED